MTNERDARVGDSSTILKRLLGFRLPMQFVAAIVVLVGTSSIQTDSRADDVISVDDPRPLAAVARVLERRHSWVVTYEDPPYAYPGDVDDVTAAVRLDGDVKRRVLVPRGGRWDYRYTVGEATPTVPDPQAILEKLVADYNLSDFPGRFSLLHMGGVFHIVPAASKDRDGIETSRTSILAISITPPPPGTLLTEALSLIGRQVSSRSGIRMAVGSSPPNPLKLPQSETAAAKLAVQASPLVEEAASTVLARTLAATGRKLSWHLYYGPDVRMYMLNVHVVE